MANQGELKKLFYNNELKVPCYRAGKTFETIVGFMGEFPTISGNRSWANCIKKIEGAIEKSGFYITKKSDSLVNELYEMLMKDLDDKWEVDEDLVKQSQHLTLVYYKNLKEQLGKCNGSSNAFNIFIKTLIIYIHINSHLQRDKLQEKSDMQHDDFIFEPNVFQQSKKIIEELNKMHLFCEYLNKISIDGNCDFKTELKRCEELVKTVIEENEIPIEIKSYNWIKERYAFLFLRDTQAKNTVENYLMVLLYEEVAKNRYIVNNEFEYFSTSEERKQLFKELFNKAEQLTVECASGKTYGLFGPMLVVTGGYDKEKNEFHFEFSVDVNARIPGEMYYISNRSIIVIRYKYSNVHEVIGNKLMKKLKKMDSNILENCRERWELFGLYRWLFSYSLNTIPKDLEEVGYYKEYSVSDYYFSSEYERENVWNIFNACEEVLYYKKSIDYSILFELNNTIFEPQEKGSYYDADYDEIWGDNHCNWRQVVRTEYRWGFDHKII